MEAALERIELKLDLKADNARVTALEAKHDALEESIRRIVSGETTSPLGMLYLQRFTDMEQGIEKLEEKDLARQAVADAAKTAADSRYSAMLWIVSIATVLNMVISFGARFLPA